MHQTSQHLEAASELFLARPRARQPSRTIARKPPTTEGTTIAVVLLYCHSELCWLWAVGESWAVLTVTFGGGLTRCKSRAMRQDADPYMPRTPFVLLRDGRVASKAYTCRCS